MAKKTKLERDLERFFTKTLPDTADKAKKDISKGLQKAGKEVVKAWKIVKKETNSWKWPIIQLLSMTVIAYLAALISFQLLK